MFSTKRNVLQLLSLLKAHGINKFVVSPGSRHIPIVISMECDPFFKLYSVVDERSASFFAIGLMQRFKEPVGIICTSGTASANYCSAISESYYQQLPLLVLTADRSECLRDQAEDQMIHQSTMYQNITKKVVNLPIVQNDNDAWFNNRLINDALLELRHHGDGPVQINIPVPEHMDDFTTETLPNERKIDRYDLTMQQEQWISFAKKLAGKRVIVVCGEGFVFTEEQNNALDAFARKFDCVILADKMSNCHVYHCVENAFPVLNALSNADVRDVAPDIIITIRANYSFNPEFKTFVYKAKKYHTIEHWYVSPTGNVVDPFHILNSVFEMPDEEFFKKISSSTVVGNDGKEYAEAWNIISESIEEPEVDYSQVYTVGRFLHNIPGNSVLHLSNSNSVRIAQLFKIDKSIEIHCNRGTDGIDGCMSTAVGFASETDKLVFLMIGDLTFFYDMNALWNRQLGNNLRILLNNNGGGAIMHMPKRPSLAASLLPNFISAQHHTSAKAWAEDRGFKYCSAHNKDEVEKGVKILTDTSVDGPIILEVFTDMLEDTHIFKKYYATIHRATLEDKLRGKASNIKHKVFKILRLE